MRARRSRACLMARAVSCVRCACRRRAISSLVCCGRCRRRCGSPIRRGRPVSSSRVPAQVRGSRAWSRRRARSRVRRRSVKTDRRDAERLARLLRLGELTSVRVPSEFEEAARDLVRAREDARAALMRARHRLSELLLRHGLLWPPSAWTRERDRWLRGLRFDGCLRSASTRATAACSRRRRAATGSTRRSSRSPRRSRTVRSSRVSPVYAVSRH
jgi:Transposase